MAECKQKKSSRFNEPKEPEVPADPYNKLVCEQVMARLGKPPKFSRCMATLIHNGRYRVNVRVKEEWNEKLSDSFFVWADQTGTIISSNPKIEKKY
jgi:hypothetical protein